MKALAMVLLFTVCVLVGRAGARRLSSAADAAAGLLTAVKALRAEVSGGAALWEAVCRAANESNNALFARFAVELRKGANPESAWDAAAASECAAVREGICSDFRRFASSLGKLSLREQLKEFDRLETGLAKRVEEAAAQAENGGRLRRTLGVLAGFTAVILFV